MKKTATYILLAVLLTGTGCSKNYHDTIGGKTPDERISAAMAAYQHLLSGAPYGWIFIESTTGTAYNQGVSQTGPKATFAYYFKFNDSNKVTMFSDFDTSMAATPQVSSYRLKALQRPVLIFDTYSYLHVPCDPDPARSQSPFGTGFGWGTDFEFSFSDNVDPSTLGDTIHLTGDLNSAAGLLIKATQEQQQAYFNGQLESTILAFGQIKNYFKRSMLGATPFEITPGLGGKSYNVSLVDNTGKLQVTAVSSYYTAGAINFTVPVTIGNQQVSGMTNVTWDPGSATLSAIINKTAVTFAGAAASIKTDTAAPYAWWLAAATAGSYWFSGSGFHAGGVDDYYGLRQIPGWIYMIYFPRIYARGGVNLDAFNAFIGGSLDGPAPNTPTAPPAFSSSGTTFTPDGRIIVRPYSYYGSAGSLMNSVVSKQIDDPAGYYLVLQSDGKSYDMVGAADATVWIQWTPFWNQ